MKVWKRYELKDLRGIGLMNTERDRLNGGKSVINCCIGDNDECEKNVIKTDMC